MCGSAAALAALLLLQPIAARAACNPSTCNNVFACGFQICGAVACETILEEAGTVCRSAAGVCDLAETCNGSSAACPTDRKKSAATTCRGSTGDCDAAERCTGSSAQCPADVGIPPVIDRVILMERTSRSSGGQNHGLNVTIEGADLCSATFESEIAITSPIPLGDETPSDLLRINLLLNSNPLPNDTYTFVVNRGAAGGTLEFGAGAPDGSIEIVSPSDGAQVGPQPSFEIVNGCSNCGVARAVLAEQDVTLPFAETADAFQPPPVGVPVSLALEDLVGAPPALAEGPYRFGAEAIAGSLNFDLPFGGDASGVRFTFLTGTSVMNTVPFTAPEPEAFATAAAATVALAALGRRRRTG